MKTLLILAGSGMGAFLDFGMGMLITTLAAVIVEYPLEPWQLFLGGFLGFLPDADIALMIMRRKYADAADHHTTIMHRPIIVLPVATLVAWLIGGTFWAVVTALCVTWHFFHDTKALSDGDIDLFWPLPKRMTGYKEPRRVDLIDWLQWRWFEPTTFGVTELLVGSLGLFVGMFHMFGFFWAVGAVLVCWAGFMLVWAWPDEDKYE